jgi:Right handed beta helix region
MNNSSNTSAEPTSNQIINVDKDFNGNLEEAILAANDGDTVELGRRTYRTNGLSINKDITIDGIRGESIIDGRGTPESIITLNPESSGTTIQDVEIINGDSGVNVVSATDVTLQNLNIHNIGVDEPSRDGQNNFGINLYGADGFKILDSQVHDIGRKGVGVTDTDGGIIRGLTIEDINIDAEHAQSYDAGGIKLFNTNDVTLQDNELSRINAFNIWNDLSSNTTIDGNTINEVGDSFEAPSFNSNVTIIGIYDEKSVNSVVDNNTITSVGNFIAYDATEFATETLKLGDNNDFSRTELNTTDFWANERAERLIATTEDPDKANFSLFEEDFYTGGTFGGDNGDGLN